MLELGLGFRARSADNTDRVQWDGWGCVPVLVEQQGKQQLFRH